MKRFHRIVVLAAIMALVAGCGGAGQQRTGGQEQNAQPPAQQQQQTEQTQQTPEPAAPEQPAAPENPEIILATTTSTQDTGLLDVLIPIFEEQTGYIVKTIAVGTGQALKMGENGEADVLLVHAPDSEKPLVESGVAINRRLVMHNDFIIIGPADDPAGVKETTTAAEALKNIADAGAIFVSRGDDSGTHKKELSLWKEAGIDPKGSDWYQETGQGMGATINVANEKLGYTLTDRGTYLAQKKNIDLVIVSEGDAPLLNIYHVMQVNPDKFPMVNGEGARAFADFLLTEETQEIIKNFGVDKYGEPLFFPDGGKVEEDLTGGK
ncbi:tungstate transport system substrate-binding protein [Symbiobacterium terraclitae]|uniref:Tungstate transport system substrate-binding protein n=1 Tax=Symbiobacterium terraclitae TaxID=557451 RepID=A0ABS4JUH1_9FIRM|nr:substrate-binding domain-containing protein [Symbiobacterium terraclitae]MBP2019165.1 tungstate transport system substrate-binding protein [Symbiobacterium terraclitae]